MRLTWSDYASQNHLDADSSRQYFNIVSYWFEARGRRLSLDEQIWTAKEWDGAVELARRWWNGLLAGTFANIV